MKTCIKNDLTVIYLNNNYSKNIDFEEKKSLEEWFRDLFNNLKENYEISLNGYYDIDVYIDNYYGMVIELKKEDIGYYDYFNNQIDMRIDTHKNRYFLYLIDDYFTIDEEIIQSSHLYKYKNKLYLKLNKKIDNSMFGKLLEHSEIVYNNKEIINYGELIKL